MGSIKIGPFGSQLKLEFMAQEGFKVYGQEHVIARDFRRGNKYVDKAKFQELATCEIRPNDLVVTMMGTSGRCAVVPEGIERGIMDSHLLRVRLADWDLDPKYLCLLINNSSYVRDQIETEGKGAIMHGLNSSIIKSILLAVPPLIEQQIILAFLDRETTKIDALIAKKERVIELLQEKRTALITQAVTKGLDPNVPMRDSGVEWLGKIPAHWGLKRLKRIVDFRGGGTPSKDNLDYWFGDIPWVSPKDMKVSVVVDTEEKITPQAVRESATNLIPLGAVLIVVRSGILIHTIPVTLTGRELTLNQDLKALIPRSDILPKYLFFLISGRQKELLVEWKKEGATVESLEMDLVAQTQIPLPDEREQEAMSAFLARETAKIDSLVIKIREAIGRLKEYRTALISAAVTGKIDVDGTQ
jgi:type I restriction enzyme S subunit